MNRNSLLIISSFILIALSSCIKNLFKPEKETLPKVTMSGAHTFGCKVNGNIWIPNGTHDLFVSVPALSADIYQSQGRKIFYLSARKDPSLVNREEDSYDDMNFDVVLPSNTGEVIINENCNNCGLYCPYSSLRFFARGLFNGGCYMTSSAYTGKILFTKIDTLNRIVSGKFEFSAIDKNTGKAINVTDGRFDIKTKVKI